MEDVSRRGFAEMLAGVIGAAMVAGSAEGQVNPGGPMQPAGGGIAPDGPKRPAELKELTSGVFKPQPGRGMVNGHESHQFLAGMLKAGNIRLEMHESVQAPGAPHEAVGTHKHSEIWLMQRGTGTLYLNGVEHTMEAGDVGLCVAGDEHWIANKSDGEIAYFVVTVGPPE